MEFTEVETHKLLPAALAEVEVDKLYWSTEFGEGMVLNEQQVVAENPKALYIAQIYFELKLRLPWLGNGECGRCLFSRLVEVEHTNLEGLIYFSAH